MTMAGTDDTSDSAERRKLMQVHSLLHCLSEVLLHADGDDAILYAQVAQLGAELLDGWNALPRLREGGDRRV